MSLKFAFFFSIFLLSLSITNAVNFDFKFYRFDDQGSIAEKAGYKLVPVSELHTGTNHDNFINFMELTNNTLMSVTTWTTNRNCLYTGSAITCTIATCNNVCSTTGVDSWNAGISYKICPWSGRSTIDSGLQDIPLNDIPDPSSIALYVKYNETTTTTTTSIPQNDCFFTLSSHILNLTEYKDTPMSFIDNENPSLVYVYIPCINSLNCNNTNVNSYLYDVTQQKCNEYYSKYNDKILPKYNSLLKSWEFVYTNGQECDGYKNVFEVFWDCDVYSINAPQIVNFTQIGTCTYQMHINSSNACN